MAEADTVKVPSFSVVIPTYGDPEALRRTLTNLIVQSCDVEEEVFVVRDLIVVGDGFEEEVAKVCGDIFGQITNLPHIRLNYYYTEHTGTGNIPRALGLAKADCDWVVFCDSGTAVARSFFHALATAVLTFPEGKFITWELFQNIDPVPTISNPQIIYTTDRSAGLPYIFPGCGTAVRRDIAQMIAWPNVYASDWVYFSLLWDALYKKKNLVTGEWERIDTREVVDRDVIAIPWCLACAYGTLSTRKYREVKPYDDIERAGWNMGFIDAQQKLLIEDKNGARPEVIKSISAEEAAHITAS